MWNIRYQTIESCVWKTSVKFFTCYLDESRLRWWVTTIPMNRVPIPQNDNTNLRGPINGSSIDNIAEGVQGLCGKVNYSPLGKKQPHNLPYKLPTHTFPHHTKTFRNSNNKNHPRFHCAFGNLWSLLCCWPRCPCQTYWP